MPNQSNGNGERLSDQRLIMAFSRLQPHAFGVSCGLLVGTALFVITAILLFKGPVAPDGEVGPNLALLRFFIPGYSVSWGGALIGLIWGLVAGYVPGFLFAGFINFHHRLFIRLVSRGIQRQGLLDG
ncbi:MAG: hypothetical protein ACYTG5_21980 [Planctomycetota bacterium]|jgi:hypothetical protein